MDKEAVVVSFYGGKQYYYDSAYHLAEDCKTLDIEYDFEEVKLGPDANWADICRYKVNYYSRKLEEHKRPIIWVDIDTRIIKRPDPFLRSESDFAAFLRNFKYFREYDPFIFARTFHPGFLFFNYTAPTRRLLEQLVELEKGSKERGTDDYFFEEAWRAHSEQLQVTLLPPKRIAWGDKLGAADAWFSFGDSGNVRDFVKEVAQHDAPILEPSRQYRVLKAISEQELKAGKLQNAAVYLKKMTDLDPSQDDPLNTLARLARRQEGEQAALALYEGRVSQLRQQGEYSDRLSALLQRVVDFCIEFHLPEEGQRYAGELAEHGTAKGRAFAQGRMLRLGLEQRAKAAELPLKQRPLLWWMEQPYPGNFGDILNPYIVEKLTGRPPRWVAAGSGALVIGSVIKFAKKGTPVWGTGSPRLTDKLHPQAVYKAVRGPLTRRLVLDSGGKCPQVYGDVALLLPQLYQPKGTKKHKLGLIRHFTHVAAPLEVHPDVKVIDIMRGSYDGIEAFLDEVSECEHIISTSLHGLIVAQAYGIPVGWAVMSTSETQIPGGNTKFEDYFASVGLKDVAPFDLAELGTVTPDHARLCQYIPERMPDLAALREACPFPLAA